MANNVNAGSINISIKADGSSVNATVDNVKQKFSELGTHGVSSMQAVSAGIRIAEGGLTNSLRAAERFLASFESIRAVAQAAFPVVGLLAVGGILAEMVGKIDKAVEAFKKLQRSQIDLQASVNGVLGSIRMEGDQLGLKLAQLEQQLNKINGKPTNNIKIALYEARIEADKLNESMIRIMKDVGDIFKQESMFSMEGIMGSVMNAVNSEAGDKDLRDIWQKFQDQTTKNGAIKDPIQQQAAQKQNLQAAIDAYLDKKYSAQNAQSNRDAMIANPDSVSPMLKMPEAQTNRLRKVELALAELVGYQNNIAVGDAVTAEQKNVGAAEDNKSNNEALKGYREALNAARASLAALKSEASSAGSDDPLVKGLEEGAAKASVEIARLNQALKEGNHAPLTTNQAFKLYQADTDAGIQKSLNESSTARAKELNALNERMLKDLTEIDAKHQQTLATIQQEIAASQQLAAASAKGPAAEAQARIELELAKIPDQDIKDATRVKLQNELAASVGTTTKSIQEQTQAVDDQIAAYGKGIDVARQLQLARIASSGKDPSIINADLAEQQAKNQLQDLEQGRTGSFTDGLTQWRSEWNDSMESAARITKNTLGAAVEDLNTQLSKLVTGQKTNFGQMFMSISEQMAKTGLKQAENVGLKILFGDSAKTNGKPDGSPGNPLHVIWGGVGGASASGGGSGAPESSGSTGGALGAIAAAASGGGGQHNPGFGGFNSSGLVGGLLKLLQNKMGGGSAGQAPDQLDYNLPAAWQNPEQDIGGVAGGSGSSAGTVSGIGGFVSSIFGALLPHFAAGGSTGSSPILVGERGTEIFYPGPAGGTITPNNKLGGTTTTNYYVDARGSTDAAATKQQVRQGLEVTHQSAIQSSMKAIKEYQKRRPLGG